MKKLVKYCDPGHGWLAVKRKDIHALNIQSSISVFSYQKGNTVYLEEDCDASKFIQAYESFFNNKPLITVKHTNSRSPIRSYENYQVSYV